MSIDEVYTSLNVVHTKTDCSVCSITTQKPIKRLKWK
jgi:hypothetical protein